jgi:nucleoside-diphosphate-sugar epimerase
MEARIMPQITERIIQKNAWISGERSERKMKILVTGGTGFIGSRMIRFLCSSGITVRVLCRPSSDISVLTDFPVQIYKGDILDSSSVELAVEGCDYVFHLAGYAKNWAKDPQTFFRVNVTGTKNVLDASRKARVKKAVLTSTCLTLSTSNGELKKESDPRAEDFFCEYERTKFLAEQLISAYVQSGLPVVVVNPTRVFGPGLLTEGNSATKMIQLYLEGKWRFILGDGSALGNYVFVDDVVRGHWLALQRGCPGEKYTLGGENLTYNEFFRVLGEISQHHYRMIHVPYSIAAAFSELGMLFARLFGLYPLITRDWVRLFASDWAVSSERARSELGYEITPFYEALRKTVVWLSQTPIHTKRLENETLVKYS